MAFDKLSQIINVVLILLVFICWISLIIRFLKNKNASVKTVDAVVVDKYKSKITSRYQSTFNSERYIVVFFAEGKKLSFTVSEFTYEGYKIKEKGKLKYKGDKIIDFK